MMVPRKGGMKMVAWRVADIIGELGYEKVILKSDQEPAIVELQEQVKQERCKQIGEISKKHRKNVQSISETCPNNFRKMSKHVRKNV